MAADEQSRLVTCSSLHCKEHIEFDANLLQADVNPIVSCPHCKLETTLFVSQTPPISSPQFHTWTEPSILTLPPVKQMEEKIIHQKKCPFCAEKIQSEAIKCKHCGETLPDAEQVGSVLGFLGFIVFLGGIAGVIYYWRFFDTSVGSDFGRINNIGLLQDRQTGVIVSAVFSILGLLCALFSQHRKNR